MKVAALRRAEFPRSFRHAGQPSPIVVRGRTWTRGEYARFLVREGGYDYDQAAYMACLPRASVVNVASRPYRNPRHALAA